MRKLTAIGLSATGLIAIGAPPARAQSAAVLRDTVQRQQRHIADQDHRIDEQRRLLDALSARLAALEAKGNAASVAVKPAAIVDAAPAEARDKPAQPVRRPRQFAGQSDDTRALANRPAPPGTEVPPNVAADWRTGGPLFRTADGYFTFHPRVRVMLDGSTTHGSNYAERNIAGTEARALFLGAEGTIGQLGYKLETDISNQQVSLRETYLSYIWSHGGRQTQLYLGAKINDRSIDGSSADTLTPLMERSAVAVLTTPQKGFFGFGLTGRILADRWHASIALSGDSASKQGTSDDTLTLAARAHWNPVVGSQGFVHLGAWGYREWLSDGVMRITRSDPVSTRFNDNLRIDSGPLIDPYRGIGYGVEAGGVFGSAYLLGEYGRRDIGFHDRADASFVAASIYGGYFLTGESPGLSRRTGAWAPIRVKSALTEGGAGAWEIVARYDDYRFDNLDLGGSGRTMTLGVNWYLNNWARLMLNYYRWRTDNRSGDFKRPDTGDTLGLRASFAF